MIRVFLRINSEGLWEEVAPTGLSGHRNVESVCGMHRILPEEELNRVFPSKTSF